MVGLDRMWDRGSGQGHRNQLFLGRLKTLPDGIRNTARLADSRAHVPVPIAHDDQCVPAQSPAAFVRLLALVRLDDPLLEFEGVRINLWHPSIS